MGANRLMKRTVCFRYMPTNRKYIETSLFAKHEAIIDLNSGMSIRAVARKNGASIGAVCNWKRQEYSIKQTFLKKYFFRKKMPAITQEYDSSDIWNLDETGLFWRGLPQRSLLLKEEKAKRGKLSKESITITLIVHRPAKNLNY